MIRKRFKKKNTVITCMNAFMQPMKNTDEKIYHCNIADAVVKEKCNKLQDSILQKTLLHADVLPLSI